MITMNDVARHAGVSMTTVSLVLNKRKRVDGSISEQTRQRVLASVAALNYRTNELAKSMVTGKNRVLGIVTTPSTNPNVIRVLEGANAVAEQKGYLLKIIHLSFAEIGDAVVSLCQKWRLGGVIGIGFSEKINNFLFAEFDKVKIPLALVDAEIPSTIVDERADIQQKRFAVRSDDAQGIRLVISHLKEMGHRNIGFLGGAPGKVSVWRERIVREAAREADMMLPERRIQSSSWTNADRIEEAVWKLLGDEQDRPTAIVCSSDGIATVTLRIAWSLGIPVPMQLSLTGYSNTPESSFCRLTTVDQHFQEMGRVATQYLIANAEGWESDEYYHSPKGGILIPTQLIERGSVAIPQINK